MDRDVSDPRSSVFSPVLLGVLEFKLDQTRSISVCEANKAMALIKNLMSNKRTKYL